MNLEKIRAFISMQKDLRSNEGVIDVDVFRRDIHMRKSSLMKLPNIKVEEYGNIDYPYKAFTVIDGIELFTLLSKEDFAKLLEKDKEELLCKSN